MPSAYARPSSWSGAYVGVDSSWDFERVRTSWVELGGIHSSSDRDVINAGLFAGYQKQFGSIVLGLEANLIGNEFDFHKNVAVQPGHIGNCPAAFGTAFNCVGRITNLITVGPRVGLAAGNWMPYVTGGWATGSTNFRLVAPAPSGVTVFWADNRQDGWFLGGGLDWKLAPNVVIGAEYRHTDLGTGPEAPVISIGGGVTGLHVKERAESDAILLRGSLLFGGRDYAPLK
jgi:opacity protein-like surface antigen